MLRQRLLTAAVLAPAFIAAIYWLPLLGFAILFAAVIALAAAEWAVLAGLALEPNSVGGWLAALVLGALLTLLWSAPLLQPWVLLASLVGWLVACAQVLLFRANSESTAQSHRWWQGGLGMAFGLLLLAGAWVALLAIRQLPQGSNLLLILFAVVWLADAGAYFAGRAFGKRRLAPQVSPGKTWEGALGGMLAVLLLVSGGLALSGWMSVLWLPTLILLVAISVFGDLFESVLKRSAGKKDSGALLPGHGGVLDRIDSIIAVLPFYGALLLQKQLPPVVN